MQPLRLQFFKMKGIGEISKVRKLRQAGDVQPEKTEGRKK